MRRFRTLVTLLFILLLLFDVVRAFRVWWYGLKSVSISNGRVSIEPMPFTGADCTILILLVGLQAALIYAVWKAWRSASVRV
jgi:multisubunit Na+/H+ antiporter MnhB subunit